MPTTTARKKPAKKEVLTIAAAVGLWAGWRKGHASPNTLHTQSLVLWQMVNGLEANNWPVTKLTYEHLDGFLNDPKDKTGRSNRGVRLAAIRSFYVYLRAKSFVPDNPAELLKVKLRLMSHEQKEVVPRVPFTHAEYEKLYAHLPDKWRWWVMLAYWSGLRLSDCAGLEWASILPSEIIVWTKKTGSRVALPIDDPLLGGGALRGAFFEMMENAVPGLYVFPDDRAISQDPERRCRHSVYFSRFLKELDIKNRCFHGLRHSFATRLAAAGKTVESIGRLMGHAKNSDVTQNYIH